MPQYIKNQELGSTLSFTACIIHCHFFYIIEFICLAWIFSVESLFHLGWYMNGLLFYSCLSKISEFCVRNRILHQNHFPSKFHTYCFVVFGIYVANIKMIFFPSEVTWFFCLSGFTKQRTLFLSIVEPLMPNPVPRTQARHRCVEWMDDRKQRRASCRWRIPKEQFRLHVEDFLCPACCNHIKLAGSHVAALIVAPWQCSLCARHQTWAPQWDPCPVCAPIPGHFLDAPRGWRFAPPGFPMINVCP